MVDILKDRYTDARQIAIKKDRQTDRKIDRQLERQADRYKWA